MRRIGIIANPEKVACKNLVQECLELVEASGRKVLTESVTHQFMDTPMDVCPDLESLAHGTDLLVVFGGDGTMLRVARDLHGSKTPILGVNAGNLGFLTATPAHRLKEALSCIWEGRFYLEDRALIAAKGLIGDRKISLVALNDFVFGRRLPMRMLELQVKVDQEILTSYRCDGLIISSPTGSTAYSLAAGGAVVAPTAEVFAITPICPHTLSNRSVIVSLNSQVEVRSISRKLETMLVADGQVEVTLAPGDAITIQRSRQSVCLLHLAGSSFFETLRQKLSWSGSSL